MKEAVEMAQGSQSNRNRGRYGQDFSAPPKQGENESRADYNQRLKEWQRRRSMSGGKEGTQTRAEESREGKECVSTGSYWWSLYDLKEKLLGAMCLFFSHSIHKLLF